MATRNRVTYVTGILLRDERKRHYLYYMSSTSSHNIKQATLWDEALVKKDTAPPSVRNDSGFFGSLAKTGWAGEVETGKLPDATLAAAAAAWLQLPLLFPM